MEGNVENSRSPYLSVSLVQGQALIIQDEYLVIVKTFVIIPMIDKNMINVVKTVPVIITMGLTELI